MNILSVFDGMACGKVALDRANIKVDKYFASEIDKYAIRIAMKNHPDIIQLGDIQNWKEWDLPKIDMLIGGSPCQGFSFAGKGLNFDDPRSKLFFVYVKILKHLRKKNPQLLFLLENVRMKKEYQHIISEMLGVEPIMLDSALVSAQSRKRLYWTNIEGVTPPADKGLLLRDVLQDDSEITDAYLYSINHAGYLKHPNQKAGCLTGGAHSGGNHSDMTLLPFPLQKDKGLQFLGGLEEGRRLEDGKSNSRNYREGYRIYSANGKSSSLSAQPKGGPGGYTGLYDVRIGRQVGRRINNGKRDDKNQDIPLEQRIEVTRDDGKSGTLTTAQKDNLVIQLQKKKRTLKQVGSIYPNNADAGHIYSVDGLARTLKGESGGMGGKMGLYEIADSVRKLTPIECERLQTLPDNYTEGVSNTQRYKMLGNGWTVDMIAHIFSFINIDNS